MVEDFNRILENVLMKVFNAQRNDWDVCMSSVMGLHN